MEKEKINFEIIYGEYDHKNSSYKNMKRIDVSKTLLEAIKKLLNYISKHNLQNYIDEDASVYESKTDTCIIRICLNDKKASMLQINVV